MTRGAKIEIMLVVAILCFITVLIYMCILDRSGKPWMGSAELDKLQEYCASPFNELKNSIEENNRKLIAEHGLVTAYIRPGLTTRDALARIIERNTPAVDYTAAVISEYRLVLTEEEFTKWKYQLNGEPYRSA